MLVVIYYYLLEHVTFDSFSRNLENVGNVVRRSEFVYTREQRYAKVIYYYCCCYAGKPDTSLFRSTLKVFRKHPHYSGKTDKLLAVHIYQLVTQFLKSLSRDTFCTDYDRMNFKISLLFIFFIFYFIFYFFFLSLHCPLREIRVALPG